MKAALALLLGTACLLAQEKAPPKPRDVHLAMRDGLRFDPPRFTARPGELLELQIENGDTTHQPHNFLLLAPGTREAVTQAALAIATTGAARDFVPEHPAILFHSALLLPEQQQRIELRAPQEPGIYPYLCTIPGHSAVMYGALYVGVPMPPLAQDENIPPLATQGVTPGGGRRPFVQRMFMPDCGPAAIAVALPGEQNYCWDAGACRLRYAWRGAFIDAGEHWRGKGAELARLPAEPWWRAENFPLRVGLVDSVRPPVEVVGYRLFEDWPAGTLLSDKPWWRTGSHSPRIGNRGALPQSVQFLGYRLTEGVPEFHYLVSGVDVFERITAEGDGLVVHFRIPNSGLPATIQDRMVLGDTFTLKVP